MPNSVAERLVGQAMRQIKGGDYAGASQLINQALGMDPGNLNGLSFGAALAARAGNKDRALNLIENALKLAPGAAVVIYNAAEVFLRCGEPERAREFWERLVELAPRSVETFHNLAIYHSSQNDVDEAEMYYRKVIELNPKMPWAHMDLGNMLKNTGRIEEAVSFYREGARLYPQEMKQSSNYLYSLQLDPSYGPEQIHAEHSAWGRTLESAIPGRTNHGNDRSPDRRLRVGYVSPNFGNHVIGFNLLPLLRRRDHSQFEIHCYFDTRAGDEITDQLRQHTDVWHDTAELTDAELADLVARDQMDILVDLTMHLAGGTFGNVRAQTRARPGYLDGLSRFNRPATHGLSDDRRRAGSAGHNGPPLHREIGPIGDFLVF